MLTEKKRKLYLFTISFCMNLVFFLIAHFLKLPLWLDTTGTIFISLSLNFPAGFLIGLINNTILSLGFFGFNSIFYYIISAAVALTTSICVKKSKEINMKFALLLSTSLFFVSVILAIPLTIALDGGIPSDYWGRYLYELFLKNNIHNIVSTIMSVSIIKFFDIIATVIIVIFAYKLTPQKIKNSSNVISTSYRRQEYGR